MQSVSISQLDTYFAQMLKTIPETRREMFETLAEEMLADVRQRIGGAGKVQRWQERYVGSGGGWAAARAKAKTYADSVNRYAVGYVTNAIEGGHSIRKPGQGSKDYRPRIQKMRVPGKGFYADANAQADRLAQRAVERFKAKIEEELR